MTVFYIGEEDWKIINKYPFIVNDKLNLQKIKEYNEKVFNDFKKYHTKNKINIVNFLLNEIPVKSFFNFLCDTYSFNIEINKNKINISMSYNPTGFNYNAVFSSFKFNVNIITYISLKLINFYVDKQ